MAVNYLIQTLKEDGISCHTEKFDAYLSNPIHSHLVIDGEEIPSRPRSFSESTSKPLHVPVIYDHGTREAVSLVEQKAFLETVSGKLVLGYGYDERYAKLLEQDPYSMDRREKTGVMTEGLLELTEQHRARCEDYRRIVDGLGYDPKNIRDYYDIPMMPVRLFKERELKSINDDQIFKTMTSSGTTGQQVSKIFLDEQTAANQQLTLAKIVRSYTGKSRLPMIIIDCPSVIRNRAELFSFLPPAEVERTLRRLQVPYGEFTSEQVTSLEDAFIGLTGKY